MFTKGDISELRERSMGYLFAPPMARGMRKPPLSPLPRAFDRDPAAENRTLHRSHRRYQMVGLAAVSAGIALAVHRNPDLVRWARGVTKQAALNVAGAARHAYADPRGVVQGVAEAYQRAKPDIRKAAGYAGYAGVHAAYGVNVARKWATRQAQRFWRWRGTV